MVNYLNQAQINFNEGYNKAIKEVENRIKNNKKKYGLYSNTGHYWLDADELLQEINKLKEDLKK